AVILLVLADVFLTVLYARIGTGIVSDRVAKAAACVFKLIAGICGTSRDRVLSFAGPTIVVLILFVWTFGLAFGTALVVHPLLGSSVISSNGPTPTDFLSALYAAGNGVSIVQANNFVPTTPLSRIFLLFESLVGTSIISLTIAYLLQVYSALRERNTLGLKLHVLSRETDDAAELVAALGFDGEFKTGYSIIAEVAAEMTALKESHHFYPVLFYFRFTHPYYSVSRTTHLALDAVTLIRSALDEERFRWLQNSAAVCQLGDSSLLLVKILENAFLPGGAPDDADDPEPHAMQHWREHFLRALDCIRSAGIPVVSDRDAGAQRYVELRRDWEPYVQKLGRAGGYQIGEVDPSTAAE
ncbi:MAG TPA: hypothetical protein VGC85_05480, partial [Chthoniobacterales bacterium]